MGTQFTGLTLLTPTCAFVLPSPFTRARGQSRGTPVCKAPSCSRNHNFFCGCLVLGDLHYLLASSWACGIY